MKEFLKAIKVLRKALQVKKLEKNKVMLKRKYSKQTVLGTRELKVVFRMKH